jgi:spore coat polysaccharide biosynthesis protein SpsF
MKTRIFIQARMGSSRLPGKVLKSLAGKPQLQHLLDRLGKYTSEKKVHVVTSDLPLDDAIEKYCQEHNVSCLRGSEWDVLDRFYQAAVKLNANADDVVVRITADCPLHHESVVDFALNEFEKNQVDYFTNSFAPDFEDGCDTEVFRFHSLEKAANEAKLLSQREHVTPYIKDSGLFRCAYQKCFVDYTHKLSVDTEADHALAETIFQSFPSNQFTIKEVLELLRNKPELLQLNKESVINAGYAKSLANDKEVK